MSTLTIPDVDEATLAKLRREAAQRSQTVEAYARELLKTSVRSRSDLAQAMKRSRDMTPNVPQTDSTEIIRQIRDE